MPAAACRGMAGAWRRCTAGACLQQQHGNTQQQQQQRRTQPAAAAALTTTTAAAALAFGLTSGLGLGHGQVGPWLRQRCGEQRCGHGGGQAKHDRLRRTARHAVLPLSVPRPAVAHAARARRQRGADRRRRQQRGCGERAERRKRGKPEQQGAEEGAAAGQ